MMTIDKETIKKEILSCLKQEADIVRIVLFGSFVKDNFHSDSDIDILILLKKRGIHSTYRERLIRNQYYSRLLNPIREFLPVDVVVFTQDEWNYMKNKGSLFAKEIEQSGYRLK